MPVRMVLLKRLIGEGAPIHAVGIQGHWRSGRVPFDDIEKAITDYAVARAEGQHYRTGRHDPRRLRRPVWWRFWPWTFPEFEAASAEDLKAQAEDYGKLFAIFEKHKDAIERVTFWGLNDRRTWRWGQHPLLLDANNKPKLAYAALVNKPSQD